MALGNTITNNRMIKTLALNIRGRIMDKKSAMIIIKSLYRNNTITKLILPKIKLHKNDVHLITEEVQKVNSIRAQSNDQIIDLQLSFIDLEGKSIS